MLVDRALKIELRPLDTEYIQTYHESLDDQQLIQNTKSFTLSMTLEDVAARFVKEISQEVGDPLSFERMIMVDGVFAGTAGCSHSQDKYDVGYWITYPYRGKGLATRALKTLIKEVRLKGYMGDLHAGYAKANTASGRVLEKCGFSRCGESVYFSKGMNQEYPSWEMKLTGLDIEFAKVTAVTPELFALVASDPDVARNTANFTNPLPVADVVERYAERTQWEADNPFTFERLILVDGKLAGSAVSFFMDDEHEVGYWIGAEFRGKGVASRACQMLVDLIREKGYTGDLVAGWAKDNPSSGRVLEKCGFIVDGEGSYFSVGIQEDRPCWRVRLKGI